MVEFYHSFVRVARHDWRARLPVFALGGAVAQILVLLVVLLAIN